MISEDEQTVLRVLWSLLVCGSPTINNESESELTGMQIIDNIGYNYKYGGFANELAKLYNVPKSLPYPPHV